MNYNLATQACETRQSINTGTRDIIDNQNANARAILDAMTAQRIEAKDAKIAEQNQQLFAAQLAASQAAQNETLKAYMSGQLAYYNPALFRLSCSRTVSVWELRRLQRLRMLKMNTATCRNI